MTTFYVATLARYILVDADDEGEARAKGVAALRDLDAAAPGDIRTIRPATADEVEFAEWHAEALARERTRGPASSACFGESSEHRLMPGGIHGSSNLVRRRSSPPR